MCPAVFKISLTRERDLHKVTVSILSPRPLSLSELLHYCLHHNILLQKRNKAGDLLDGGIIAEETL